MSTNLLENQDFIELARKISILELYSLMILNRSFYSQLVLKKRSKHSKKFGTSLNKSVTFFFEIAQACSVEFKSGE